MDRSHLYRLDHAQHHLALTTLLLTKNDRLTSADPHHSVEEEEECTLSYSHLLLAAKLQHSFSVQPAPSDTLALSNRLIVNPSDFRDGEQVLVKGDFPLTVKYVHVHSALQLEPLTHPPDTTTLGVSLQVPSVQAQSSANGSAYPPQATQ
jgi:predicted secreted protein